MSCNACYQVDGTYFMISNNAPPIDCNKTFLYEINQSRTFGFSLFFVIIRSSFGECEGTVKSKRLYH